MAALRRRARHAAYNNVRGHIAALQTTRDEMRRLIAAFRGRVVSAEAK